MHTFKQRAVAPFQDLTIWLCAAENNKLFVFNERSLRGDNNSTGGGGGGECSSVLKKTCAASGTSTKSF